MRPRQISDEAIMDAARDVFVEQGASASTALVAERAGVSQAVLFQRFGTKQKLLQAALTPPRHVDWFERCSLGPDERDIRLQLRELAEQITRHFERIMPAMLVLKASGVEHDEVFAGYDVPPPQRGHELMRSWFAIATEQGRLAVTNPAALAMAFVGALQSWVFLRHLSGEPFDAVERGEHVVALVDLLWEGIEPEEAP